MGQIHVSQRTQTTTQVQVQHETRVHAQQQQPVAPPEPSPDMARDILNAPPRNQGSAPPAIDLKPAEPPKPTSPERLLKNLVGGTLVGGAVGAAGSAAIRSMAASALSKPSVTGIAVGATLAVGRNVAHLETGDKAANMSKNMGAGALIGGSVGAMGSAAIRSMASSALQKPSLTGIALGAAMGVGIAVLNSED